MYGNAILEQLLGSKTRARLLELLLAEPGARLHVREIVRRSGVGPSSVQRELQRLEGLGLVRSERSGSNRFYSASPHPLQPELRALVLKAASPVVGTPSVGELAASERVNPRIRSSVPALADACRRHHVSRAALFGSATQVEEGIEPRDVDVLVTFESLPPGMRAAEYLALVDELEAIVGMPVDVVVSTAVRNPYLREEIERTEAVLYEVA